MSAKKFKFVSPGVFLNEIDNSQLPKESAAVGPVIIGRLSRGPGLKPVRCESYSEFIEIFGNPIPGGQGDDVWREGSGLLAPTYAAYAAQAYFRNSSPVNVVRLLGIQDKDATTAGAAGWKAAQIAAAPAAYGIFVGNIPHDNTEIKASLGAIIYAKGGDTDNIEVRLSGKVPTSGMINANVYQTTSSMHTFIMGAYSGSAPEFTAEVYNYNGGTVESIDFNFDRNSSKFIRKVFNTNPTVTNTEITDAAGQKKYWLGESYEQYVADTVFDSSTYTTHTPCAFVLPLKDTSGTPVDHADMQLQVQAANTGWVFSQDLTRAYATYDGHSMQKLFRFVAVSEGDDAQNNFKISVEEIRAPAADGGDKYGSFTVTLRQVSDTDNAPKIVEKFSGCSLNPNSANYVARKIGDQYSEWKEEERRYRWYGNYANRSKYIRIVMNSDVDQGLVEPSLLPFGFVGPPVLKDFRMVSTEAGGKATSVGLIRTGNGEAVNAAFTVNVPVAAGGTGDTYTVVVKNTGLNGLTPTANQIFFACTGNNTVRQANLILAFNGTDNTALVKFGTPSMQSGGIAGVTASIAVADSTTTITATQRGTAAHDIVLIETIGDTKFTAAIGAENKLAGGLDKVTIQYDGTALDSAKTWIGAEKAAPIVAGNADPTLTNSNQAQLISGSYQATPGFTGTTPSIHITPAVPLLRSYASDGNLSDQTKAYWGLQTVRGRTSTRFDHSYLDIVRPRPDALGGSDAVIIEAASNTYTKPAWVFTLDDIVIDIDTNSAAQADSNKVHHVSGSRKAGTSYTAITRPDGTGDTTATDHDWRNILSAGYNRFTMPLFGGFDGVDITEPEPFNNRKMGVAGATALTSYEYASVKRAIDAVSDAEVIECNLMAMPGITNPSLTTAMVRNCEARADALAVIDLPDVYKPAHEAQADTFKDRLVSDVSQTAKALQDRNINSSYGCTYYPWVKIYDEINDSQVWVPPSIVALGVFANTENRTALWFAPAGFNRGGLTEGSAGIPVIGVTERLSSTNRDDLYEANINPIASFPAEGIVVFGQKTLQTATSALDRINVRRMMIFVKKEVSRICSKLLFEQNVQATWDRFTGQVRPFLERVKIGFGLTDFKVVLDESTTTPELIDRNIMYAKIFLKPARSIEFIAIDFVITNTGAAFED